MTKSIKQYGNQMEATPTMVHCNHPLPYHPHTEVTKFNIIIINIDDTILQLLLLPQRLPLVPLPDLFCLRLYNLRGETKLKKYGMRFLCMTFIFFLFIDGDAVLPELAGSEFVSVKFLRLGLGFLKLHWSLPPKSPQLAR